MGTSFTILVKHPLELSVEVDREIQLEISTGFGPTGRPQVGVSLPITAEELGSVIEELKVVHELLKKSWTCECGTICSDDWGECSNCDKVRPVDTQRKEEHGKSETD